MEEKTSRVQLTKPSSSGIHSNSNNYILDDLICLRTSYQCWNRNKRKNSPSEDFFEDDAGDEESLKYEKDCSKITGDNKINDYEMNVSNTSLISAGDVKVSGRFNFGFCRVCGDKANGLHYGCFTCEACKVRKA